MLWTSSLMLLISMKQSLLNLRAPSILQSSTLTRLSSTGFETGMKPQFQTLTPTCFKASTPILRSSSKQNRRRGSSTKTSNSKKFLKTSSEAEECISATSSSREKKRRKSKLQPMRINPNSSSKVEKTSQLTSKTKKSRRLVV